LIRQLTLACCLTLVARGAAAQHSRRLEFFVVASTTGTTVGGAEVLIERTVGALTRSSSRLTADSAGRFALSAPPDERLLITVRRLGFLPSELTIAPSARDDVFMIALAPAATMLAPTVTTAEARAHRLDVVGFYERKRERPGAFLDSAAIAKQKAWDMMSLLRPYLRGCTTIFVDGIRLLSLRDVKVEDVLAIEIYRSNEQAPPQFANPIESMGRCGSIVVWRRF
jgi:hypothetical protein